MQTITDSIYVLVLYSVAGIFALVGGFLFLMVHNQNKLLKQKRRLQEAELTHQKALLHAVIQSQETERQRIGRDLHDEIGGGLAALRLNLNSMQAVAGKPNERDRYKEMIDNLIGEVRNISHNLSPPGLAIFGLAGALGQLCATINAGNALTARLEAAFPDISALPEQEALALYRVMQELLSNTIKHAGAQNVTITIQEEGGKPVISYADDGKGCDPAVLKGCGGIGLQNIESRLEMIGAQYEVLSAPGSGFKMRIALPARELPVAG